MKSVKLSALLAVATVSMTGLASSAYADPSVDNQNDYHLASLVAPLLLTRQTPDASATHFGVPFTQSGRLSAFQVSSSDIDLANTIFAPVSMPSEDIGEVRYDGTHIVLRKGSSQSRKGASSVQSPKQELATKPQAPQRPRAIMMPKAKLRLNVAKRRDKKVASINPKTNRHYDLNINGGTNRGKLFGTLSIPTQMKKARNRWLNLERRTSNDIPTCVDANCFADRWQSILTATQKLPARKRVQHVNRSINKLITYKSDMLAFQSRDYWASPAEAYRSGGDCEDFAIAKYWMLREVGYKPNDMRLVVVRDTMVNQWHAVLAVRHGDDWAILDNRFSRIRMSSEMPHFKPVYTVNEVGTWMQRPKTGKSLNQLLARK